MRTLTLLAILALSLGGSVPARAEETRKLALVGPVGTVRVGDPFTVEVQLTSAGTAINAVELLLRYPIDTLRLDSVARGGSALTLWPEPPTVDPAAGTVRAVGGTPNGLYAMNARVLRLEFTVLRSGTATLGFDPARTAAYRNDGQGSRTTLATTPLAVTLSSELTPVIPVTSATHPDPRTWYSARTASVEWVTSSEMQYSYAFGEAPGTAPDDLTEPPGSSATYADLADGAYTFTVKGRGPDGTWTPVTQRMVRVDGTAPEPFTLEHPDPTSVGGASVLTWSPTDAASGIARSELLVDGRSVGSVESPLHLERGWRGSTLTVTVVDHAGNTRSASWVFTDAGDGRYPLWVWSAAGALLLALGVVALRMRRTR